MQVNLHFVMFEDLSDAPSPTEAAGGTVARIQIIRECAPGDVDFDDPSGDADPQT